MNKNKTHTDNYYKNLNIQATSGVHNFAMDRILELNNGEKKHILDLACGTGAFTQRSVDNGFKTTSVDISSDKLPIETEYIMLNLNNNFSEHLAHNKYDFIVALEIIEHLENPFHFLLL